MEILLVLGLLFLAIILFATEKFSVDLITAFMLIILTITGIITPTEAFSGFGSDFTIMLVSLFVVSAALQHNGLLDLLGSRLLKIARIRKGMLLTLITGTVAFTSAFMNNTTVTAIYMAPVMSLGRRLRVNPSKLLIPVAFASILGGTCTIIGTSTNLAVNGYLAKHNYPVFGMFDLSLIGVILCITGLFLLIIFERWLLPDRKDLSISEEYHFREYMSEIVVLENSKLAGQRIADTELSKLGFRILNIIRGGKNELADPYSIISSGDLLIVEGNLEQLIKIKEKQGLEIRADVLIEKDLVTDAIRLAEVMVTPNSELVNNTVKSCNFRMRYGLVVIAINRDGYTFSEKIGDVVLRTGDILLVQGSVKNVAYQKNQRDLVVLQEFKPQLYKKRKAFLTLFLFILAIILGTLGILPMSVAFMTSAFLSIALRCISIEKSYESIDWRLVILIAGMSAFGTAMTKSGAAAFLANGISEIMSPFGPMGLLAGYIALTVFLTQPMSNAAAALVILPVALETAHLSQLNPMTFAAAVMLSASISLITPFEPSCILVYGPGQYKFVDFLRSGILITIVLMAIILMMVPLFYPF
jgi:di/tricarboxylate transporter